MSSLNNGSLFSILMLALLSTAVVGCSPFGDSQPQVGARPQVVANCDQGVSQKQIDNYLAQNSNSNLGTLRGTKPFRCATNHQIMFSGVSAVPALTLGHATKLNQDVGDTFQADVEIALATLSEEELQTIAQSISGGKDAGVTVALELPKFDAALLGDLPEVTQQLVSDESGSYLRFYVPKVIGDAFSQKLNDFANGSAAITFYSLPEFDHGVIWSAQGHAGDALPMRTSALQSVSANQYLTDLWTRISNANGASTDKVLPYLWMDRARLWWPNLKMQPADGQRDWQPAWIAANNLWSKPGANTDDIGAASSLKALRFLLTVDPTNAAKPYADKLKKLEVFLGGDDQALYDALMSVTSKGKYTDEQTNAVFDLATRLSPISESPATAWNESLRIAKKVKFEKKTLDAVATSVEWVHATQSTSGIAEVEGWIFDRGVTADRLTQMKLFYEFLIKQNFAGNAWEKTIDFAVNRGFSKAELEAYQAVVEAVRNTSMSAQAFEKAESYLLDLHVSADRMKAIASTIKWLASTSRASIAIEKAEEYVLKKHMEPSDVFRIQRLWIWMQQTSRNLEALEKAEQWVIELKLTSEQTSAIILSYEWLVYIEPNAFAQSEDYVINKKLTLDQIDQMRGIQSWMNDTPVGPGSTAKAEDYVINKKLSRMQTDLIEVCYLWLRDTSAKPVALNKAEDYVLNRKLNADKLKKLRDVYTKYSSAGDKDSLAKAEAETFGN